MSDIQKAIAWFENRVRNTPMPGAREMFKLALVALRQMRSGRWEEWWPPKYMIMTGEEMLFRCSECGAKYADVEGMRYCPYCGARME